MDNSYVHINTNTFKDNEILISRKDNESLSTEVKTGLLNIRALVFLLLWYIFSGCTLFLNKYILTYLNGNPTVLGNLFIVISTIK